MDETACAEVMSVLDEVHGVDDESKGRLLAILEPMDLPPLRVARSRGAQALKGYLLQKLGGRGLDLSGLATELAHVVEGAVVRALAPARQATSEMDMSASGASSQAFVTMAQRMEIQVVRGLLFERPPAEWRLSSQVRFEWLANRAGTQDEVASYPAALKWLQEELCPAGVAAVLKHDAKWLKFDAPHLKLRVRPSATDVLLCMEEAAAQLRGSREAVECECYLPLSIVGQVELKTETAFKAKRQTCIAQSGVQHLSACHMLDAWRRAARVSIQHRFVTCCTDLVCNWVLLQPGASSPFEVLVTESPPAGMAACFPDFTAAAVHTAKGCLAEAASALRKIREATSCTRPMAGTATASPRLRGPAGAGAGAGSSVPRTAALAGDSATPGSGGYEWGSSAGCTSPADREESGRGGGTQLLHWQDGGAPGRAEGGAEGGGSGAGALGPLALHWGLDELQERLGDEGVREVEAAHSASLVAFLRTPLGYEGLLGLDAPPSTVQHPSLFELWQHPPRAHTAGSLAYGRSRGARGMICRAAQHQLVARPDFNIDWTASASVPVTWWMVA